MNAYLLCFTPRRADRAPVEIQVDAHDPAEAERLAKGLLRRQHGQRHEHFRSPKVFRKEVARVRAVA